MYYYNNYIYIYIYIEYTHIIIQVHVHLYLYHLTPTPHTYRNPVPDHYTVTLEVYRDRITAIEQCQDCTSYTRSLNKPCQQMVRHGSDTSN